MLSGSRGEIRVSIWLRNIPCFLRLFCCPCSGEIRRTAVVCRQKVDLQRARCARNDNLEMAAKFSLFRCRWLCSEKPTIDALDMAAALGSGVELRCRSVGFGRISQFAYSRNIPIGLMRSIVSITPLALQRDTSRKVNGSCIGHPQGPGLRECGPCSRCKP